MKIIIAPSKTMQFKDILKTNVYPDETYMRIHNKLKKLSKVNLGIAYNIKGKLLDETYKNVHEFDQLPENAALKTYTGLVFFGMDVDSYSEEEWEYAEKNLRILSAFYGELTPRTMIKQYRLDYKTKIDMELYKYRTYSFDEVVINLASKEFSKAVTTPMITIGFRDFEDGKYKNKATYAKQARGVLLNYLIKNQINSVEGIKEFSLMGYSFNLSLSNEESIIFTR